MWIIDPEIDKYTKARFYGEYDCLTEWGGQGAILIMDDSKYIGQLINGIKHGEGEYIYSTKDPSLSYKGEFANGLWNGYGTYKWKNGNEYTGYWKDGKKHGKGVLTASSGER